MQQRQREAPLDARVVIPSDLGTRALPERGPRRGRKSAALSPSEAGQTLSFSAPLSSNSVIGDRLVLSTSIAGGTTLGRVALSLTPTDRTMLAFLARHPFHSTCEVATALGWQDLKWVQRHLTHLVARALLSKLEMPTAGNVMEPLLEVTRPGLVLVGAWHGLSVRSAARLLGLVGGGPAQPVAPRQKLVKELAHTRGVDAIFLGLIRTAREFAAAGGDDALVEWRNAAACCRGHLRPDGYGLYRHGGQLYGFFLEYDRGTMSLRSHLKKLASYFDFWASGRFARDYVGFPTVLVVTTTDAAEERFAHGARLAAFGRAGELPLLLTCERRLREARYPRGFLDPIWCTPRGSFGERRSWLRTAVASFDRKSIENQPADGSSGERRAFPGPGLSTFSSDSGV